MLLLTDGNKDQLRFKNSKVPLIRNSEEVSLRPAANSMVFSANMKPQNLPLSNSKYIIHFIQYLKSCCNN